MERASGRPDTAQQKELYELLMSGERTKSDAGFQMVAADGRLYGPFASLLLQPNAGKVIQAVGHEVRFNFQLPPDVRELSILMVARAKRSRYEWYAHAEVAYRAGVPQQTIQTLLTEGGISWANDLQLPYLQFTQDIIDGQLFDGHLNGSKLNLSMEDRVELVTLVHYYALLADLMAATDPPLPEEVVTMRFENDI